MEGNNLFVLSFILGIQEYKPVLNLKHTAVSQFLYISHSRQQTLTFDTNAGRYGEMLFLEVWECSKKFAI